MAKIKDEIIKLENQILELQNTVERLKVEEVVDTNDVKMDFFKLEKAATNNKLLAHPITECDAEVMYKYCVLLAMIVEQSEDVSVRIKQYYHVLRIYHVKEDNMIIDSLIRDARISSVSELIFIKENLSDELLIHFLVDVFILISIDERQDKQIDFMIEIFGFYGIKKKEIKIINMIVKAVLEMSEEQLLQISSMIDINSYFSYIGKCPEYIVVPRINDIKNCNAKTVLIYGDKICDKNDIFNIDGLKKDKVIFKKCTFDNVIGFVSSSTEVVFDECKITNCVQNNEKSSWGLRYANDKNTTYFMNCKKITIINSLFEKCHLLGVGQNSRVFMLENASLKDTSFIDCRLAVSTRSGATGAVLYLKNSVMSNCELTNCTVYGEGSYGRFDSFHMRITSAMGGRITDNKFIKCYADSQSVSDGKKDNYILVSDDRCKESNNSFKDCDATQTWNYERCHGYEVKVKRNQDK